MVIKKLQYLERKPHHPLRVSMRVLYPVLLEFRHGFCGGGGGGGLETGEKEGQPSEQGKNYGPANDLSTANDSQIGPQMIPKKCFRMSVSTHDASGVH